MAFFKRGALVLLRSISFGSAVFYDDDGEGEQGAEAEAGIKAGSPEFAGLIADFVAELSRSLSYAQIQLKEAVNTLFLTGEARASRVWTNTFPPPCSWTARWASWGLTSSCRRKSTRHQGNCAMISRWPWDWP
jgi:hypothetical protein